MEIHDLKFDMIYLKSLVNTDIEAAKAYVKKFFFQTRNGYFFYNMTLDTFDQINNLQELSKGYISKDIDNNKKSPDNFNVLKWIDSSEFKSVNYETTIVPDNPERIIFKTKKFRGVEIKTPYLNMLKSYHLDLTSVKKYDEFPQDIKQKMNMLLNHIKEVWANGCDKMYEYILNWLACTINGKKLRTFLYLSSLEGTGKSMVIDFIKSYVLGQTALITSSMNDLTKWTKGLEGRLLINLNEAPVSDMYQSFNDILKSLVTEKELRIEEKNKSAYTQQNTFNIIITTNNNSVSIGPKNKHRTVMLDISEKYIGNKKYFTNLIQNISSDDVGECFYAYMKDIFNDIKNKWNENNIPSTKSFQTKLIDGLSSDIKFLKQFLKDNKKTKQEIEIKVNDFYEQYKLYCESNKLRYINKASLGLEIIRYKVLKKRIMTKGTREYHYILNYSKIIEALKSRNFIHEDDELDYNEDEKIIECDKDLIIKEQEALIKKLQDKIKALENKNVVESEIEIESSSEEELSDYEASDEEPEAIKEPEPTKEQVQDFTLNLNFNTVKLKEKKNLTKKTNKLFVTV